jgi:hypothetical protein
MRTRQQLGRAAPEFFRNPVRAIAGETLTGDPSDPVIPGSGGYAFRVSTGFFAKFEEVTEEGCEFGINLLGERPKNPVTFVESSFRDR